MIYAKNTPHNTGIAIYGDYLDFENLYEALHTVLKWEGEADPYEAARIRVFALCYDIRHALMRHREIEFIDNGMDEEMKKRTAVLAPNKNIYLKIYVLWPEMLFAMMVLNEFLVLYAQRQAKLNYSKDLFTQRKVIWDNFVVQVRMLQTAVSECLKQIVPKGAYARMLNIMNLKHALTYGYCTHYIDLLNYRFIRMNSERRLKNISIIAKRIAKPDQEYRDLEAQFREEAKRQNCRVEDLRLDIDYLENIEW